MGYPYPYFAYVLFGGPIPGKTEPVYKFRSAWPIISVSSVRIALGLRDRTGGFGPRCVS